MKVVNYLSVVSSYKERGQLPSFMLYFGPTHFRWNKNKILLNCCIGCRHKLTFQICALGIPNTGTPDYILCTCIFFHQVKHFCGVWLNYALVTVQTCAVCMEMYGDTVIAFANFQTVIPYAA